MVKLAPAPRIAKNRSLLLWTLSWVTGSCWYLGCSVAWPGERSTMVPLAVTTRIRRMCSALILTKGLKLHEV